MAEFQQVVVLVTIDTPDEADRLARVLLDRRKVACVNVVPGVSSHFWWKGSLDQATEALLIIKTRASLLEEVVELIKAEHPYDVPEVIALPIVGGNQDYLNWVDRETGS